MKKLIPFFIFLLIIVTSNIQGQTNDSTVKANPKITKTFERKFQNAGAPNWYIENGMYKAVFVFQENNTEAYFDNAGKWIKTSSEIPSKILPSNIRKYIKSKYGNAEISNSYHIEYVKYIEFKVVLTESINDNTYSINLTFNEAGEIIDEKVPAEYEELSNSQKDNKSSFEIDMDEFEEEMTDVKISSKELPTTASDYINKNFKNPPYTVTEVWLSKENNKTIYKVSIKKDGSREITELLFDFKGNLIEE